MERRRTATSEISSKNENGSTRYIISMGGKILGKKIQKYGKQSTRIKRLDDVRKASLKIFQSK